jgi:hypothetical protein
MRRDLPAGWLLMFAVLGCESVEKVERDGRRQRDLYEVNQGVAFDRQLTPRTARERDDPLLIDPQSWPEPERPGRP